MKELWKNLCEIRGLEDLIGYQVSNLGRLKSFRSDRSGKVLKTSRREGNGAIYEVISLKGSVPPFRRRQLSVHRLVLMAFNFNDRCEKLSVDHINENSLDNRLCNLQWMSIGDNIRKSQSGSKLFSEQEIVNISLEYLENGTTLENLAQKYNCALETMWRTVNKYSKICNTKRRRIFSKELRSQMAETYLSGKTLLEVSTMFSCSQSMVSLVVKQYKRGELNDVTGT